MDAEILDKIPFEIDLADLLRQVHVGASGDDAEAVGRLVAAAQPIARPKALCKVAYVEDRTQDAVVIGGVTFTSRVLRVNLDQVHRVFAFVATCGTELETWSQSVEGMLEGYWADAIKHMALRAALGALDRHIVRRHRPGRTSTMNPGSLEDWPMEQQRRLFSLLGDTRDAVGVELTDSLLMVPTKSVSGLRFPAETRFESCQLCPRKVCPGRRAPYDEDLYARKFAPKNRR